MNIEEYIASGILELYVLGELSPAEMAEVEEKSARYPEVQQELDRIQDTLRHLALQSAVDPRPALKNDILDQIEASATPAADNQSLKNTGKQSKTISWLQYGIAASIALAIVATLAAFYFRSQWKSTEQLLNSLQAQNQQIAQQYEAASHEVQQLSQDLSIVSDPDFRAVKMEGLEPAPNSVALVYWNPNSNQVYLKVDEMPVNSSDKQYQLWAIVDGKPVSAGVFDVTNNEPQQLIAMQDISDASAFAVTLEPQGGSESPTMDAMYVMGEVASS